MTNEEEMAIFHRFWQMAAAVLDEAQQLKLKTIEYLLFNLRGKNVAKAAELLSEMGF